MYLQAPGGTLPTLEPGGRRPQLIPQTVPGVLTSNSPSSI